MIEGGVGARAWATEAGARPGTGVRARAVGRAVGRAEGASARSEGADAGGGAVGTGARIGERSMSGCTASTPAAKVFHEPPR